MKYFVQLVLVVLGKSIFFKVKPLFDKKCESTGNNPVLFINTIYFSSL